MRRGSLAIVALAAVVGAACRSAPEATSPCVSPPLDAGTQLTVVALGDAGSRASEEQMCEPMFEHMNQADGAPETFELDAATASELFGPDASFPDGGFIHYGHLGSRCCPPDRQLAASRETDRLFQEDQADRERKDISPKEWDRIVPRDYQRRTRISELFAAGCLVDAKDFAAAALIYQHGEVPEHFLQAFFFASRAAALGSDLGRHLMPLAIDRYLMMTNHKQLFGSQASSMPGGCSCLFPVEPSFPDDLRLHYMGKTIKDQRAWVRSLGDPKRACPDVECPALGVQPTPRGSVLGLW